MRKKLSWLVILAFVPFAIACSDDDNPNPTGDSTVDAGVDSTPEADGTPESDGTPETDTVATTNFEKLQIAANAYLSVQTKDTILAAAPALSDNLIDGDDTNDPYIVSVRSAEHYALGHIPGAVNHFYKDLGTADLSALPTDKEINVYCYTGHTGGLSATTLNIAGYEARNVLFGIMSWTKNATVRGKTPFAEHTDERTVETTENTVTDAFDPVDLSAFTSTDTKALVFEAYGAYITSLGADGSPVTKASVLFENLNDGDDTNNPQIISVRSAEDYAKGHITGAINIPWTDIAKPENLAKIDPSKPVVVYCYTGHTGAIASTALALLGYDVKNLLHGIMSWTSDADVRVKPPFSEDHASVGEFVFEGTEAP
ncbi:MAG: hypothetical protein JRH20_11100 [Deltaproteobacteria bacterium]|nr:hypothetical protein [Deltaproteobacteria bacterium]